jgi:2-polyprenyl-6-hydroxyphenyl methylase/3-demethylubiquinone-9 3-methyltransferase
MWEAIENAAGLMKGDGLLYIALYTTDARSDHWLEVKKKYNAASAVKKRIMELSYVMRYTIAPCLLARETFQRTMRSYRQRNRGMSYLTDVRDWLGGYPFEHAKIEEVLGFCRKRLGLELVNIKTGEANTEYLFKRR